MARTQQPVVTEPNKGGGESRAGHYLGNDIWNFSIASGAPTNGTSGDGAGWAGPGSVCHSPNGNVYRNGGTKASPTWSTM